jgi:UDP-glucose 4-epimerase
MHADMTRKDKAMRVLVTGGAGFIGSHVVDHCVAARHTVAVVDNLWSEGGADRRHVHPEAQLYEVDVTDADALLRVFDEVRPEFVSHQAAQHSVAISTKDPLLDARVNVEGLINVLSNCVRVGTRKIVFASSGATYGTPEQMPVTEMSPQRPESPYGITKMAAEHYLRYWQMAHGLKYTALRYANVYGPRQDPSGEAGVIAIFARRFLAGQPIRIDWDGEQTKDYVYVEDVARANLLAISAGDNDVFCIATGESTSVNQIYRALVAATGVEPEILRAPKRPGDVYRILFDRSKAQRGLGWTPSVDLNQGIARTVTFFRDAA